ncbi:MAG: bdbD [Verrucomicrobiales bacterium]|nr:bdbD [Verrucomicrobiales bacterium]
MKATISPERLTLPIGTRDHIQGLIKAPMILLEYGDYECPFCGQAHPVLKQIQQALGKKLCFAYRHFPLTQVHPHSEHAAEAAEAAEAQGSFWEMHDLLFENQEALEDEYLASYATALELDVSRVVEEVLSGAHTARVREDFLSGIKSGLNGTPTFFMNGMRYDGPRDARTMIATLEELYV